MTETDVEQIRADVDVWWPGQRLWRRTASARAAELLSELDLRWVRAALKSLAREGRESPPSLSLLQRRALDLAESERQLDVQLDELGEPTEADRERWRRWRPVLQGEVERLSRRKSLSSDVEPVQPVDRAASCPQGCQEGYNLLDDGWRECLGCGRTWQQS